MALSQKHFGKMLVPWFNSAEWRYVKDLIFGDSDVQKRQALDIIQMWKLRTPKLPSGVEGTLIILKALLLDKVAVSEENIQDLYGTAILRFLNLCGASGDKQGTFYKSAKGNNIPDWLITLRHNVAHDPVLPSQFMLNQGLYFCFDWVKREYWEKQNLTLKDCIAVPEVTTGIDLEIRIYCELNLVYYLNKHRILCVKDVASVDANLHQRINECRVRRYIHPAMKVSKTLRFLLDEIGTLISSQRQNADLVAGILVTGGSLFAVGPVIKDNGICDIAPDFIQIWKDIVNLLCAENMLFPLLKQLLNVSIDETPEISKNGSLWLALILKSLLFAKTRHNNFGNIPSSATNELEDLFNFDFASCTQLIVQIETLHLQATSNPHTFSLIYLPYLLQLCNCPTNYIAEMESLHKLWITPRDCPVLDYEVPTTDEVEQLISKNFRNSPTNPINSGEADMEISSESKPKKKKWQRVEDTSIYEGCPLGVLAFQSRDMNPLLEHNFINVSRGKCDTKLVTLKK